MALAVVGAFSGAAFFMITGAIAGAKEKKLVHDVATINAALSTFLANGGDLSGATTGHEVIERLKTQEVSQKEDQLVGVSGGLLDPRVTPVDQTLAEGASSEPRALWDRTKKRFVLKYSGAVGIKEFVLDELKAAAEETEEGRLAAIRYSEKGEKKWVWEYAEHNTSMKTGPNNLAGRDEVSEALRAPLQLESPTVSLPGDLYPLGDYEGLQVTLSNPNPPGVSDIFYSLIPGVWEKYSGALAIDPGMSLETQAVAIDPLAWTDSSTTFDQYTTTPVKIDLELGDPNSGYDYVNLGGALEPGSYAAPALVRPLTLSLSNSAAIPAQYSNVGVFNVYWTLDGSDPTSSSEASAGDAFSDGFPGQPVWLSLDDWGSAGTLDVNVVAKSADTNIVLNSDTVSASLDIRPIALRAPLIVRDPSTGLVTISLQVDFGDMPLGSRIVYTTDGTDPGIGADGEAVRGALYSTPFSVLNTVELKARVYAPPLFKQWFTTSELTTSSPAVALEEPGPNIVVGISVSTGP